MLTWLRKTVVPPAWALATHIPGGVALWERGLKLAGMTPLPAPVVAAPAPAPLSSDTPPPPPASGLATAQDVLYCYRILLLREPDPAGWQFWTHRVANFQVPIVGLRDAFMFSEEFRLLEAERSRPRLTEVDGFKLFYMPRDWLVGEEIARHGVYEGHVIAALKPLLQPGKVFLDIGANIGYYTLVAASRVGPTGKVIAFEPHPKNSELLAKSIQANGFAHVHLYPMAVSDKAGVVELVTEEGVSNASLAAPGSASADEDPFVIRVKAVVPDVILQDEPRIDIVKMDIEGVEPLAWRGMQTLLRRHRPIVFTEFNPEALRHQAIASPEEYLAMITALDYRLHILDYTTFEPTAALTNDEIMARYSQAPSHHLDLVAYPQ